MEGEDEDTGDPHAFSVQANWKKLIILAAGSFMNLLLGVLLVLVLVTQIQNYTKPVLKGFMDGFPLEGENGLMVGDELLRINGERVYLYDGVTLLLDRADGPVDLVVRRNGERVRIEDLPLEPKNYEYNGETGRLYYGLLFESGRAVLADRLQIAWRQPMQFIQLVKLGLIDLIGGKVGLRDMSGVVGIVDTISSVGAQSETVQLGLLNVIYFVAFIAINLAVMNLLPIPALDGGRIAFVLINLVVTILTGKQIDPKYEGYVHMVGLILLLGLMALVAVSDIRKLFW
jgi:regulator of sigma E protease